LVTAPDVNALYEQLSRHGFVFAVYSHGNDGFSFVFALNNFGNENLRSSLAHAKQYFEPFGRPAQTRIRGREVYQFDDRPELAQWEPVEDPFPLPLLKKPAIAITAKPVAPWLTTWFEGNDLVVVGGPAESIGDEPGPKSNKTLAEMHLDVVAAVLDTTDGKQPNVERHASYQAAINEGKDLKGFEPVGLFFMRLAEDGGINAVPPALAVGRDVPRVDTDLRQAAAEVEELPPAFPENDLDFGKSIRATAKPWPDVTVKAKRKSGATEHMEFTPAQIEALGLNALASETQRDNRWKPAGKLVHAFEGLPGDVTFLAVADHRDSHVPNWIAGLPSLTQLIINMNQEEDLDNASPWALFDMFCLPSPGRFQAKINRSRIPKADDLRPFLFPSVLAATVDERGYRLISRGAFPLALIANEAVISYYFWLGRTKYEGLRFTESLHFRIFGLDPCQW
jgi:hypothetical protein